MMVDLALVALRASSRRSSRPAGCAWSAPRCCRGASRASSSPGPVGTAANRLQAGRRQIDVALDPHPYCGGTTTCDALWMGVPVVSLAGRTAVSRAGATLLANVGLGHLVARTPEQYVELAAALIRDAAGLAALRRELRERIESSPVMNAPQFARDVEAAFRTGWRAWCRESDRRSPRIPPH